MVTLPKDVKNIILQMAWGMEHSERLNRCHAEMLVKCFVGFRPSRVRYVSYFLWL